VRIIAEPGRYFAETSATLFTAILGQRASTAANGDPFQHYYLSDGTFGSFRIQVAVDGLEPSYSVLRSPLLPPTGPEHAASTACRLWGDSDRNEDCVHAASVLPYLRDGDWLSFPYAGAYTICSASNFAGQRMAEPTKIFVCSAEATRDLGEVFNHAAARAAVATVTAAAAAHRRSTNSSGGGCAEAAAAMMQALSVGCCVVSEGEGSSGGGVNNDDAMSTASESTVLASNGGSCGTEDADSSMGGGFDD